MSHRSPSRAARGRAAAVSGSDKSGARREVVLERHGRALPHRVKSAWPAGRAASAGRDRNGTARAPARAPAGPGRRPSRRGRRSGSPAWPGWPRPAAPSTLNWPQNGWPAGKARMFSSSARLAIASRSSSSSSCSRPASTPVSSASRTRQAEQRLAVLAQHQRDRRGLRRSRRSRHAFRPRSRAVAGGRGGGGPGSSDYPALPLLLAFGEPPPRVETGHLGCLGRDTRGVGGHLQGRQRPFEISCPAGDLVGVPIGVRQLAVELVDLAQPRGRRVMHRSELGRPGERLVVAAPGVLLGFRHPAPIPHARAALSLADRVGQAQLGLTPPWPSTPTRSSSFSLSTPPGCSATSSARKRAPSARTAGAT
jgi:hypothetical protein